MRRKPQETRFHVDPLITPTHHPCLGFGHSRKNDPPSCHPRSLATQTDLKNLELVMNNWDWLVQSWRFRRSCEFIYLHYVSSQTGESLELWDTLTEKSTLEEFRILPPGFTGRKKLSEKYEFRIPPPPVLRGERNSQRNTNSEFSPGFTGREKETLREIRILNSPPVLRGEKETLREIRILNSPPVLQGERNSQRTHLEEFWIFPFTGKDPMHSLTTLDNSTETISQDRPKM